jgi:hypothetical protein
MNPINDDELKREIEQALSVEPSPRFAAGVRARITKRPRPALWIRWSVRAVAFAAVIVVVVIALQPRPAKAPEEQSMVMRTKKPAKREPPSSTRIITDEKPFGIAQTDSAAPRKQEPEVLIDPRVAAGLETFIAGVQAKRIDAGQLVELQKAAATPNQIEEIPLKPIGVDPIVIEPLNPVRATQN